MYCIWSRVTYLQCQRIENHSNESTAHALWLSICRLHRHVGVLGQVNHLRKAFGMHFTKGQAIEPVIDSMIAVIDRVFELGTPTRKDMIAIVMLQGLSPDFEVLREVIEASGNFDLLSLRLHLRKLDVQLVELSGLTLLGRHLRLLLRVVQKDPSLAHRAHLVRIANTQTMLQRNAGTILASPNGLNSRRPLRK
jgi:gag-polypeptide of LTR copia-type